MPRYILSDCHSIQHNFHFFLLPWTISRREIDYWPSTAWGVGEQKMDRYSGKTLHLTKQMSPLHPQKVLYSLNRSQWILICLVHSPSEVSKQSLPLPVARGLKWQQCLKSSNNSLSVEYKLYEGKGVVSFVQCHISSVWNKSQHTVSRLSKKKKILLSE